MRVAARGETRIPLGLPNAGEVNPDAAWYYPDPTEKAANIKDHIAFWKGVTVED